MINKLLLLASLLLFTTAALPQTPAPAPADERSAPSAPAKPAPRLNLRLDDAASYAREAPRDEAAKETLPSLGGNAMPLEAPPPPRRDTPSSSYPVGK